MLIRYKKSFEKIAMGLLSFMPDEKEVRKLQQTVKEYEVNPDWQLFLWKEEDVLGVIGVVIEKDVNAVIKHVSVNPSHRNSGIGTKMVKEVMQIYGGRYAVCSNDATEKFLNKCEEKI